MYIYIYIRKGYDMIWYIGACIWVFHELKKQNDYPILLQCNASNPCTPNKTHVPNESWPWLAVDVFHQTASLVNIRDTDSCWLDAKKTQSCNTPHVDIHWPWLNSLVVSLQTWVAWLYMWIASEYHRDSLLVMQIKYVIQSGNPLDTSWSISHLSIIVVCTMTCSYHSCKPQGDTSSIVVMIS